MRSMLDADAVGTTNITIMIMDIMNMHIITAIAEMIVNATKKNLADASIITNFTKAENSQSSIVLGCFLYFQKC